MKKSIDFASIKPQFSGHETFSLRHSWLKKYFDWIKQDKKEKDLTNEALMNQAILQLGVGKNMVSSMRYWALSTSMIDRENQINHQYQEILDDSGFDPWLENSNSLWFIHYQLASNPSLFLYYMFFNYFNHISNFDKDDLKRFIKNKYLEFYTKSNLNDQTLEKDIDCLLKLYSTSYKISSKTSYEEKLESTMTELLLIEQHESNKYSLKFNKKSNLSIYTFVYALLRLYESYHSNTLSFDAICYDPLSPGRIFTLDTNSVGYYIQLLQKDMWIEYFRWDTTSGLKTLALIYNRHTETSIEQLAFNIFKKNYTFQKQKEHK
jgi:hypothetical protein